MKLTAHVIEPKPTISDPLAQRGHVALIWDPDKELFEIDGDLNAEERAAHVALSIATQTFASVYGGAVGKGRSALNAVVEYGQKIIERNADEDAQHRVERRQ